MIEEIPHAKTQRRKENCAIYEPSSVLRASAPLRELLFRNSRAEIAGKKYCLRINPGSPCLRASVRGFCLFSLIFFMVFPLFSQNPAQIASLDSRAMSLEEALGSLSSAGAGNAELNWDPFFLSGKIIAGRHEAAFISGGAGDSGAVLLDYKDVLTVPLPYLENGNIRFPEAFVNQVKSIFSRYAEEDRYRLRIAAIIIDPGHGGKDPGATGTHTVGGKVYNLEEKDITLKVARRLYASMTASFPDKRVILTREGDTFPTLDERVAIANTVPLAENEAAIYISVHANASFNKDARGYEVWYLSPGYRRDLIDSSKYADSKEVIPILNSMLEEEITTESILIAQSILKRLEEAVGKQVPSRGLKAEEWFVVRNTRMPSVLVELGFVTNETEALLLNDDAYLMKLSEALYKGICDFIAFFERSGGFTALQ